MELTKVEVAVLEEAVVVATEKTIQQLNDLQLALVGGGMGDTINA